MAKRTDIAGMPGYGSFIVTSTAKGQFSGASVFIYSHGEGPSAVAFNMTADKARDMAAALIACAVEVENTY